MTVYNDQVNKYIVDLFAAPDAALEQIFRRTPELGLPAISVKPEEGRFLQFLVRIAAGQSQQPRALEIGSLGGYSGTWIARGLPPGGKLITLEKEPAHAEVARQHFQLAGVADRVEIRQGDAHELLTGVAADGPFDFIFIDAEKQGYPDYFDWALENVRVGGVIAAHNAFRKGSVAGTAEADQYTAIMQAFNRQVANEPRVISTIYPAGDGTVVAVRLY